MVKSRKLKHSNNKTKRNDKKNKSTTLSKMNCSPAVKGKTILRDSCLTPEVLVKIKEYYNLAHPDSEIKYTNPSKIWTSLKRKLKTCSKEDCWLALITDNTVRLTLDKYLFAPDHPASWKSNPYTWLNTNDIHNVLRQYEDSHPTFCVIRPSAIDFDTKLGGQHSTTCVTEELCKFDLAKQLRRGKSKFGIVFNLDKHDEAGSHWVSLYIDIDDKIIYYMDSAGDPTPGEIKTFAKRVIEQASNLGSSLTFYENHPIQHQYSNTECGMYSLFFIITMLTGETDKLVFKNLDDKIHFFKTKRVPDRYISKFRKIYFNT